MPKKTDDKPDPRTVILDELTFTIKIDPSQNRVVTDTLVRRIAGADGTDFMKQVTNYLASQLTYGICGKEAVLVEHHQPGKEL
jgi:hypothetical protein